MRQADLASIGTWTLTRGTTVRSLFQSSKLRSPTIRQRWEGFMVPASVSSRSCVRPISVRHLGSTPEATDPIPQPRTRRMTMAEPNDDLPYGPWGETPRVAINTALTFLRELVIAQRDTAKALESIHQELYQQHRT